MNSIFTVAFRMEWQNDGEKKRWDACQKSGLLARYVVRKAERYGAKNATLSLSKCVQKGGDAGKNSGKWLVFREEQYFHSGVSHGMAE